MATFTAGGKDYHVSDFNFIALELAWPYIQGATEATNPIAGVSASIMVIAAGITQEDYFKKEDFGVPTDEYDPAVIHGIVGTFLKRQLKAKETSAVKDCLMEVIKEAGLEVTEGELLAVLDEIRAMSNPSAGTAQDTSQSSLQQDAKEEAGTA